MRKKVFLFPLLLSFLIILFLTFGLLWWKKNTAAVNTDKTVKNFVIIRGSSATDISNKLYKEGLIKSSLAFKIYVQVTGKAKNIPAGQYSLSSNLTLFELFDEFAKGPTQIWVTIPEGLRREEIAERFIKTFEISGLQAEIFKAEFLKESEDKEGYLFPDTYLFPRDVRASVLINKLTSTFSKRTADLKINKEVVILASMVERETKENEEKPVVAGIILKRKNAKWPLQIDATIQYAIAIVNCKLKIVNCNWWPTLTKDDLEINSTFNTYKNLGFPPSPIANPGLESLKAAFNPKDSPYWFYLHDSSGLIHYAKTLAEHNQNIRIYLGK